MASIREQLPAIVAGIVPLGQAWMEHQALIALETSRVSAKQARKTKRDAAAAEQAERDAQRACEIETLKLRNARLELKIDAKKELAAVDLERERARLSTLTKVGIAAAVALTILGVGVLAALVWAVIEEKAKVSDVAMVIAVLVIALPQAMMSVTSALRARNARSD
jgi:uncharacterized membrane protein YqjE